MANYTVVESESSTSSADANDINSLVIWSFFKSRQLKKILIKIKNLHI
jgi:hypothetical protein